MFPIACSLCMNYEHRLKSLIVNTKSCQLAILSSVNQMTDTVRRPVCGCQCLYAILFTCIRFYGQIQSLFSLTEKITAQFCQRILQMTVRQMNVNILIDVNNMYKIVTANWALVPYMCANRQFIAFDLSLSECIDNKLGN